MPATTLSPAARRNCSETYDEVSGLIRAAVRSVVRKCGGDFDELLSEANMAYLDAWQTFDGSSSFTSWVWTKVWYRCTDVMRNRFEERARFEGRLSGSFSEQMEDEQSQNRSWLDGGEYSKTTASDLEDRSAPPSRFVDLLDELGSDAKFVAELILETPPDLALVARKKGGEERNLRSSIRQYLAEAGWTVLRVAESFREVQRAISE